jgi:hypothetical protein
MFFDLQSRPGSIASQGLARRARHGWLALACLVSLATAPAAAQDAEAEAPTPVSSEGGMVLASNEATSPGATSTARAAATEPEAAAQEGPATSFTVGLNQDAFFGFYGTATGSVELAPGIAFTAYTILWTTPSFSVGGSGGGGLWTEFGAGVAFTLLDGALNINPQIGILNGVLLSGGSRPLAFEGIVPNLTANYQDDLLQAQVYFGYYLGLREQRPNDFIHYWVNAGVRPTSFLALGAHWEHLVHSRGAAAGGNENLYMWIGPYAEVGLGPFALRFTAGVDVAEADTEIRDFYKVNIAATF